MARPYSRITQVNPATDSSCKGLPSYESQPLRSWANSKTLRAAELNHVGMIERSRANCTVGRTSREEAAVLLLCTSAFDTTRARDSRLTTTLRLAGNVEVIRGSSTPHASP